MKKFLLLLGFLFLSTPLQAAENGAKADLALVLAIDLSGSISKLAMRLQLDGHAAALRSEQVLAAIKSGTQGQIAVTVLGWSGPGETQVLMPWKLLADSSSANEIADHIEKLSPAILPNSTALGGALIVSAALFDSLPWTASRHTIDIVSNGFSNSGPDPMAARDAIIRDNVTINALVMLDEYAWLADYYRENVIGGYGAFVRTVAAQEDFIATLQSKLIDEIVALPTGSTKT